MKLTEAIREQIDSLRAGFYELISQSDLSIFNEQVSFPLAISFPHIASHPHTQQELELIISGLPNVDIDDLKANTEYTDFTPSSVQVQWFWRAVRSFTREQQIKLVQFVTGTGKIPVGGFAELVGMRYAPASDLSQGLFYAAAYYLQCWIILIVQWPAEVQHPPRSQRPAPPAAGPHLVRTLSRAPLTPASTSSTSPSTRRTSSCTRCCCWR